MLVYQRVFPIWHTEVSQIMVLSPIASSILIGLSHGNKPSNDLLGYPHDLGNLHLCNGNFRILKWRYCTIFQAIFCWDVPLHKPYIGFIYMVGTSNQSVCESWPLIFWTWIGHVISKSRLHPPGIPRFRHSGNETTMALYQAMRATPDHLPKERQKWKDASGSKWRLHLGGLSCPYAPHMMFLRYSPKSNMARTGGNPRSQETFEEGNHMCNQQYVPQYVPCFFDVFWYIDHDFPWVPHKTGSVFSDQSW